MDEKELQALYKAMSSRFDVGDYNTFKSKMSTTEQRKSFYDVVGSKGFDLGDYNQYETRIAGVKKKESSQPSSLSSDVGVSPYGVTQAGFSVNEVSRKPAEVPIGDLGSVMTTDYKTTDARVGGDIGQSTKTAKTVAGIYNTLVGSVARLAGGISEAGQHFDEKVRKNFNELQGRPIDDDVLPKGVSRRESVALVEQLRSPLSTKEEEIKRSQFDVTDGVSIEDVKGLLFQAPSTVLDMVGGALTSGASFGLQAVNDAAEELENNPNAQYLSDSERMGYIYTNGLIQGALERLGVNKILKSTGASKFIQKKLAKEITEEFISKGQKATADQIEKEVVKRVSSLSNQIASKGVGILKSTGWEGGTEGLEQALSDFSRLTTNQLAGSEIFDEEDISVNFIKNVINSSAQGGVFGAAGGAVVSAASKPINKEQLQKIQSDIEQGVSEQPITPTNEQQEAEIQTTPQEEAQPQEEQKVDVLSKAVDEGKVTGIYADLVKQGKGEEVLKDIAQQAQNIGSDGIKLTDGKDAEIRKATIDQFGEDVVNAAIEKYPAKEQEVLPKGEEPVIKKSVLQTPIEEVTIDDILNELRGDEGLAFKDVSNKEIKEGSTEGIEAYNQRAAQVLKTLYPNAEFKALNTTQEYQKATGRSGEAGVLIRGKEGGHKLFLNLEAIRSSDIERTATHEVVHALVSDAIGAKYSDLRKKWDGLLPKLYNVKGFEIVKEHLENYPSADRPVEGITDLLANIVHDKIKIEDIPKNLWDEFIELVNRAFEAIGLDYKITPDTFNGFAQSVKEAFDTGDFTNLKKFTAKGKTEKFFKQYPEFAEQATAMVDPQKRKQLEDLLRTKIQQELNQGKINQDQANEFYKKAGIEPPKVEAKEDGGDDGSGITHAQTAETRTKFGFEEYEKKPETFEEWDAEASERIAKGEMPKLIKKLQEGGTPSAVEQRMMGKYIAELGRKAEENPSDENLNNLHEAIVLSDIAGGREVGKSLVSRKGTFLPDDSLASFFEAERMNNKDAPLTEKQKETVKKEWEELEKAKNEYNAYVFQKESELGAREAQARIAEEAGTSATRKKGTRKTDKDFAEERKQIITDIKEKLKKARGETQATILPFAKELIAISPDVAKLVRNLVDNGITKLAEVVDRVHEILKEDIKDISKQDVIDLIAGNYSEKKKTRNQLARDLYELRTEAQLINRLDALLKGEKPKSEKKKIQRNQEITKLREQIKSITADDTALDRVKSGLNSQIQKVENQIKRGDYSKPEKKPVIKLDKEGNALRDKLIKLQQQRDARMLLQQRQNEGNKERALRYVAEVFNIPRTLMTIGDFSGLLRQNLFFSVGHPGITAKALPGMFKSFTSQKVYDRWFADLKETPRYDIIQKSRLAIADSLNHDLSKREETFMSTLAEKIPVIGRDLNIGKSKIPGLNIVKGSERSYTLLLNKVRVDMFNYFADQMEARGMTVENSPKQYKAMAEYINNATGRSDFGENLNRIAPILNATFFSPRLIASRVNMLTYWAQPRFWKTLPKEARIDYFRNWASLLAVGGTIMALAAMAGADVEDDPTSSDFGKIKSGDTRWDIWGGAQPYIRTFAQVATGKRKSTASGKVYDLDGDDIFGENRMGVVTDFFRNKLAPVPGAAVDVLSGRTSIGDKIVYQWGDAGDKEISIDQYVKDRLLPMTITGTEEAIRHDGYKSLFTVGIPSTFGVGTQTYSTPPPKEETFRVYQESGNKVRNATKEEVERYKKDSDSIYQQEIKKAELGKGWGYNKYGELTLDDKTIKKRGSYKSISEEDKKKLLSRLRSTANQKAKDKIKY